MQTKKSNRGRPKHPKHTRGLGFLVFVGFALLGGALAEERFP